jgi:hypothetical protein
MLIFLMANVVIHVGDDCVSYRRFIKEKGQIVFILKCCVFGQTNKEVKHFLYRKRSIPLLFTQFKGCCGINICVNLLKPSGNFT